MASSQTSVGLAEGSTGPSIHLQTQSEQCRAKIIEAPTLVKMTRLVVSASASSAVSQCDAKPDERASGLFWNSGMKKCAVGCRRLWMESFCRLQKTAIS